MNAVDEAEWTRQLAEYHRGRAALHIVRAEHYESIASLLADASADVTQDDGERITDEARG